MNKTNIMADHNRELLPLPYGFTFTSTTETTTTVVEENPTKKRKTSETTAQVSGSGVQENAQEPKRKQPPSVKQKIIREKKLISSILSITRRIDDSIIPDARQTAAKLRKMFQSEGSDVYDQASIDDIMNSLKNIDNNVLEATKIVKKINEKLRSSDPAN